MKTSTYIRILNVLESRNVQRTAKIAIFILTYMLVMVVLAGCSGATQLSKDDSLTGHWHQVESGIDNAFMEADISGKTIEVKLTLDSSTDTLKGIYWAGTFDSTATDGMIVESLADEDTLATSLLASQSDRKEFKYENGKISFIFKIMGDETTVYLGR